VGRRTRPPVGKWILTALPPGPSVEACCRASTHPRRPHRELGPVGVWAPWWLWTQEDDQLPDAVAELEELGFGTLWVANGPTMLDLASTVLAATERTTIATGIVNIWVHSSTDVAATYRRAEEQHPGRLLLGLGNGPREPAQWALSPYHELTQYLDRLDADGVPPEARMLAAVGPRMLDLSAARSSGAHPFLSTLDHTAQARSTLGQGPLLAPGQKVVLESDPATARAIARQALGFYFSKRATRATCGASASPTTISRTAAATV
jgi:probable F420-dependent oxidoreductase